MPATMSPIKMSPSKKASMKASQRKDRSPKKESPSKSIRDRENRSDNVYNMAKGLPVWLHVYDLGPVSKWVLNSWAGQASGLGGAFHCGIEVLGLEFSFQAMIDCGDDETSGLTWHYPKSHPRHVYRESIGLGTTPLSIGEIGRLLERLEKAWPARSYHCLRRNCTDFAEKLALDLRVPGEFPAWVHGLAKGLLRNTSAGSAPGYLMPCAWGSCCSAGLKESCSPRPLGTGEVEEAEELRIPVGGLCFLTR